MKTIKNILCGLSVIALLATVGLPTIALMATVGCASFKMVKPDGTTISAASICKEINVSRKEKNNSGYECTESYKSKVDGEAVGTAAGAAINAAAK